MREAEARWKREEGTYRDDISCIVVYLPATVAALRDRVQYAQAVGL